MMGAAAREPPVPALWQQVRLDQHLAARQEGPSAPPSPSPSAEQNGTWQIAMHNRDAATSICNLSMPLTVLPPWALLLPLLAAALHPSALPPILPPILSSRQIKLSSEKQIDNICCMVAVRHAI